MYNRIFYYLIRPHRAIQKIVSKIQNFYKKKNYNLNLFETEQNDFYKKYNLVREKGVANIKNIQNKYQFLKDEMSSEHHFFFSCLSIGKNYKIKNILEIGTYDGKNAFLLSNLFEHSSVYTIDLKNDHDQFINFYNRANKLEQFIHKRNKILSMSKNITFIEQNSIRLYNSSKRYDLIWIDGAHGYPTVCLDIINSLRLINDNGIIMCDDVFINNIKSDKMYRSIAAYETLTELKNEKIIKFDLIYKRLDVENNYDESNRKFVAIITKL